MPDHEERHEDSPARLWRDPRFQAIVIFLLTTGVYLALPEKVYFFDGVLFAGGIEYALQNPGNPDVLFRFPKHYLYMPTVYGLAWGLSWFVPAIDAYRLMQILAGCLAGVLNGVLFLFVRRRITSLAVCLGLITVWAFSNIHWERALEGQTYFAGQFWAVLALLAFARHDGRPSPTAMGIMAVCTALAGLFHVSNIIVVAPIAAVWLWREGRQAIKPVAGYVLSAAALTVVIPLVQYRFWDPAEIRRYFLASVNDSEFHSSGFFIVPTLRSLWERSVLVFAEFLVPLRGSRLALPAGLALSGLFLAMLGIGLWRRRRTVDPGKSTVRGNVLVPLGTAAFSTWAVFFSMATPGYLFHWEIAFFGLWLLLVAGFAGSSLRARGQDDLGEPRRDQRAPGRLLAVGLAILALAVPPFNLARKYWPISRDGYNRDALAAERLGDMIPPSEPLFLLGAGTGDNNLKAYMVHFGYRGWLAADITMRDVPRDRRCDAFAGEIRSRLQQRGVAFLSTTVPDRAARTQVVDRYGCPDPDALLPLEAIWCLVLDDAPEVGLVLGWDGQEASLASLQSYYRGEGQSALAERLADRAAFASCRDLPAPQSASAMLLAWLKSSR